MEEYIIHKHYLVDFPKDDSEILIFCNNRRVGREYILAKGSYYNYHKEFHHCQWAYMKDVEECVREHDKNEFYIELKEAIDGFNSELNKDHDAVNHPKYYTSHPSGVECITIARHHDFNIGNAFKYIWRAGLKTEEGIANKDKQIEDLKKAVWYINDEIKKLQGNEP